MTADPSRMRPVCAGDRREHDVGRRHGEVLAVMLADAEEVEADLIGQHALGDDVADHLRLRQQGSRPRPRSRRRTCRGRARDRSSVLPTPKDARSSPAGRSRGDVAPGLLRTPAGPPRRAVRRSGVGCARCLAIAARRSASAERITTPRVSTKRSARCSNASSFCCIPACSFQILLRLITPMKRTSSSSLPIDADRVALHSPTGVMQRFSCSCASRNDWPAESRQNRVGSRGHARSRSRAAPALHRQHAGDGLGRDRRSRARSPCSMRAQRTFCVEGHHYALVVLERPRRGRGAPVRGASRRRARVAARRRPAAVDDPHARARAPRPPRLRLVPRRRSRAPAVHAPARRSIRSGSGSTRSGRSRAGCSPGRRSGPTACCCSATRSTPTRPRRRRAPSSARAATRAGRRASRSPTSRSTRSSTARPGAIPTSAGCSPRCRAR